MESCGGVIKPRLNLMKAFLVGLGRTAFDYRLAYLIVFLHATIMGGLVLYLGIEPRYRTGTSYLRWSLIAMSNVALFYMLWLVVRLLLQRHASPLKALKTKAGQVLLEGDRLANAVHSTCLFMALISLFGAVKPTIPAINPFSWDETLIRIDRSLAGGVDPYVLTSAVFGNVYGIVGLNFVYNFWLVIFIGSMVWVPWIGNRILRLRYIITSLLTWFVGGNLMAIFFSSAGPCFVRLLTGDTTFDPLMTLLADIDRETGAVWALVAQEMLWKAHVANDGTISGISAMPSMHVGVSVILACVAWQFGGVVRWLGAAFAVCIFIGSIQLAWHYASDGIIGGALAMLFWRASEPLAAWSLLRPKAVALPA